MYERWRARDPAAGAIFAVTAIALLSGGGAAAGCARAVHRPGWGEVLLQCGRACGCPQRTRRRRRGAKGRGGGGPHWGRRSLAGHGHMGSRASRAMPDDSNALHLGGLRALPLMTPRGAGPGGVQGCRREGGMRQELVCAGRGGRGAAAAGVVSRRWGPDIGAAQVKLHASADTTHTTCMCTPPASTIQANAVAWPTCTARRCS